MRNEFKLLHLPQIQLTFCVTDSGKLLYKTARLLTAHMTKLRIY